MCRRAEAGISANSAPRQLIVAPIVVLGWAAIGIGALVNLESWESLGPHAGSAFLLAAYAAIATVGTHVAIQVLEKEGDRPSE